MTVEAMYQEIILDHYRARHHAGLREPFTAEVHHVNPSCGDEITLRVDVADGTVQDVSYDGVGCSISQASTSVLTDLVIGRSAADSLELYEEFLTMMQSQGHAEPDEDRLEDAIAFNGVAKFPARVKCALLGWAAFRDAVLRSGSGADNGDSHNSDTHNSDTHNGDSRIGAPATGEPTERNSHD